MKDRVAKPTPLRQKSWLDVLRQRTQDIVLVCLSSNKRIVDANVGAEIAYGYTHDELLRTTFGALSAPTARVAAEATLAKIDVGERKFTTFHRRRSGDVFAIEVVAQSITIADDRLIVIIGRDVSQRVSEDGEVFNTGESDDDDPIDYGRLREYFGNNDSALRDLVAHATVDIRRLLDGLAAVIQARDVAHARSIAHELKGVGANLGAVRMEAACKAVERALDAEDWTAAAAQHAALCKDLGRIRFDPVVLSDLREVKAREDTASETAMRIVAIDDNPLSLRIYEYLSRELDDCIVECFSSATDALRRCELEQVDLVIVDLFMPDIDGLEFLRLFRLMPNKAEVPALMITAERSRDARRRALDLGASDFLNKPIDMIELISRAKNLLSLRRHELRLAETADWLSDQVRLATNDIAAREREAIYRLAKATEFRDSDTGAHVVRMAHYCAAIATVLGLKTSEIDEILAAAPMHDIGKVAVPDSILLKPGKLTHSEFEIMKQHTTVGYQILKDSPARLLQTAAIIALTHHECFDGSGYPQGLAHEDIPLVGRICAVSDVFDALTSARPYKLAWSTDDAIAEMHRLSGSQFDPALIDAFDSALAAILDYRDRFKDDSIATLRANP
ncbi:MAG TPA: HD domain-containing phosphohydrolase [Candidatus Eremiobacteraceae bacterium]|jgi:putative two-component system response regulator